MFTSISSFFPLVRCSRLNVAMLVSINARKLPRRCNWTIAHVRDDVGSIYGLLCVTNALLAGVLAALIMP